MLTKKIVPMTAKEGNTKEGYQGSQETPFLIKDGGELGILRVGPLAQLRGFRGQKDHDETCENLDPAGYDREGDDTNREGSHCQHGVQATPGQ